MNCKALFYPESRFGGFTDSDAYVVFYARVNALLTPDSVVLDIGCGRGAYADDPVAFRRQLRILKGKGRRVIGIDVDPAAAANPFLDEFRRLEPANGRWPVDDASIDVAVSVSVHAAIIRRVSESPRDEVDVFPTLYRCNTLFKVRRLLRRFGFEHYVYGYQSEPSSLSFSRFFYFWGVIHQHIAPTMLKPTIFAFARRGQAG